jgi:hypothetical protein
MLMSVAAKNLNLVAKVDNAEDTEITGGYVSDLLSDVLANAKSGNVWVTNQKHQNCIAVASLLGLSGMIIAGGIQPDENTLEKASAENVPLYLTTQPAFEVVAGLHNLGVKG